MVTILKKKKFNPNEKKMGKSHMHNCLFLSLKLYHKCTKPSVFKTPYVYWTMIFVYHYTPVIYKENPAQWCPRPADDLLFDSVVVKWDADHCCKSLHCTKLFWDWIFNILQLIYWTFPSLFFIAWVSLGPYEGVQLAITWYHRFTKGLELQCT